MLYRLTMTALRDWLEGYLRTEAGFGRVYIMYGDVWPDSEHEYERHDNVTYIYGGGAVHVTLERVTPDAGNVEVHFEPPQHDDWQRDEVERHLDALRAALRRRWQRLPVIPEEPTGDVLDDWFEWRRACSEIGVKITLEFIASRTGYSEGHTRTKHSEWAKENT